MTTTGSPSLHTLGNSDLQFTSIGFGAWAIGGGNWEFGWGPQDDDQSVAAIHRALDLGVNWIDTAAVYGLGHSEEVVGRALKSHSGPRPLVFTKCSMRWHADRSIYRSLKAGSLAEELEGSLREIGNGHGHGVSPGVVAVAWTLHHPAITASIVGGRSSQQVEGLAPALHFRLSQDEFDRIHVFLAANPV